MGTHLTTQDLIKYMELSDTSEEYLLWEERITEHLEECEACRELIHEAIMIESTLTEESFGELLKLAGHEDEIRRSMVANKLRMMYEQGYTKDAVSSIVAEAISRLQMNAVRSYMLQISAMAGRVSVARGEEERLSLNKEDGIEIILENSELVVKTDGLDKKQKFTAVIDHKEKSPMICEAAWEEEAKQWVAKFNMDELMEQFELYIID